MSTSVTLCGNDRKQTVTAGASCRHACEHSEPRSSSGPLAARGPLAGPAAGGAEMCMHASTRACGSRARPVVPVGPTAGGAALHSAVKLRRGRRTARGPGWVPRPAAPRGACGSVPVMRSRRWRSASAWAVRYSPWQLRTSQSPHSSQRWTAVATDSPSSHRSRLNTDSLACAPLAHPEGMPGPAKSCPAESCPAESCPAKSVVPYPALLTCPPPWPPGRVPLLPSPGQARGMRSFVSLSLSLSLLSPRLETLSLRHPAAA
jgi:hypothetical protein